MGFEDVKIFCLVLTQPARKKSHAIPLKKTWGRKCTQLLFVSTERDEELPSIEVIKNEESRSIIWHKTRNAWQYVHDHHRDGFDWYFKVDDDAYVPPILLTRLRGPRKDGVYVVMENLRSLLASKNKEDPIAFGHKYKRPNGAYFAGGSGKSLTMRSAFDTYCLPLSYTMPKYSGFLSLKANDSNVNHIDKRCPKTGGKPPIAPARRMIFDTSS
ncbi:unnamed protein product [Darwinula stevensoni]|uniref:N-acetylgalactosaminide beta-1,3-galactosyltransferase n=1 Tax=Darwinula stevensoni TaxID=69355 RepID=A0A7R9A4Z9_9CRUS|nr:unnamed protein product [Darwinula stevensoni]CAG0884452.1 unnamed protein product [Darwinula stevensoni]